MKSECANFKIPLILPHSYYEHRKAAARPTRRSKFAETKLITKNKNIGTMKRWSAEK